jgi:hypothetical protein
VLAIDGPRSAGKSYSRDFLNYVCENYHGWNHQPHRVIYVDMDLFAYEPEDLARAIGTSLGLADSTMPPEKGEQAPRRVPALVDWLSNAIQNNITIMWWIVLDGFRLYPQPKATHDLIRALLDAADLKNLSNVRLLLVNYGEFLDPDTKLYILIEEISSIGNESDIEHFFRYLYTVSGRNVDETEIKENVKKVMDQVDAEVAKLGPEARLKKLSIGLTRAAKNLRG